MVARQYYDWCPHNTGNVSGCGVCKQHRDDIVAAEHRGRARADKLSQALQPAGMFLERLVAYVDNPNNGDSLADLRADALAIQARLRDLPQ